MTRIFLTMLYFDLGLGTAMFAYIWLIWKGRTLRIKENGWKLSCCSPFRPWWAFLVFYIPLIGILWYFVTGETIQTLSEVAKTAENPSVTVYLGKVSFTYTD